MVFKSKKKGSRGELEIAKLLTQITGERWFRVPCSGAIATTGSGDTEFRGDVYCRSLLYKDVVVEVKNHAGWVPFQDIFNAKSKFKSWVGQLVKDCQNPISGRYERQGILFFKSGRKWLWHIPGRKDMNVSIKCKLFKVSDTYYDFGIIKRKKVKNDD